MTAPQTPSLAPPPPRPGRPEERNLNHPPCKGRMITTKIGGTAKHTQTKQPPNPPGDDKLANKGNEPPATRDGKGKAAETGKATITTVAATTGTGTGVDPTTTTTAETETGVGLDT